MAKTSEKRLTLLFEPADGKATAVTEFLAGPTVVRSFVVQEGVSTLFGVSVMARLEKRADLKLEPLLGMDASLLIRTGLLNEKKGDRTWKGICNAIEQVQPEMSGKGESTYAFQIVPKLWLATQRRNHRIFQHLKVPQIIDKLLAEWQIKPIWKIDIGQCPQLEYRVQYGESDYNFMSRLLEEAGIAFVYKESGDGGPTLTFTDAITTGELYVGSPLTYVDNPNQAAQEEFISQVVMGHGVRPGAYTIRDYDFRKPDFKLVGEKKGPDKLELPLEQYYYMPGASLIEPPVDAGQHDPTVAQKRTERNLVAERTGKRHISFTTNIIDLCPGTLITMSDHPHSALSTSTKLVVVEFSLDGSPGGQWSMRGKAVFADDPFRPPLATPKPSALGVESAMVVGPPGEEIYTDEFGRARVLFPWDRDGKPDGTSSCWVRVSQGWAGTGFGALCLPRIGQEVLISYLGGDPDMPMIVGRVFNGKNLVPYTLPLHRTRSTWKSNSSIGGGGFNELMFEDLKDKELVYLQAQRDMRKLVKRDETMTIGRDRQKLVQRDEFETTDRNRTEVTGQDRTEITQGNRTTAIAKNMTKLVEGDENEETRGNRTVLIGGAQDMIIKAEKRELVRANSQGHITGDHREKVDGDDSLVVGRSRQEKIGTRYAIEAGGEIHIKSATSIVIECPDLTLQGLGGFVRIDATGISISGTLVKINSGGMAGIGQGADPTNADDAVAPPLVAPPPPEPIDVGKTGLGQ